jgi:hypothetical protein
MATPPTSNDHENRPEEVERRSHSFFVIRNTFLWIVSGLAVTAVTLATFGGSIRRSLIQLNMAGEGQYLSWAEVGTMFSIAVTTFFAFRAFYSILKVERFNSSYSPKSDSVGFGDIKLELRKLSSQLDLDGFSRNGNPNLTFTQADKKSIVDGIIQSSKINVGKLFYDNLADSLFRDEYRQTITRILKRLEKQIEAIGSRANFSLTVGLAVAAAGIVALYYSFYIDQSVIDYNNLVVVAARYIPRLSLVLIIELTAFFFLKLYSKALSEVRYFQNEITNLESKLLASNLSLNSASKEKLLAVVVQNLLATERNFVLEKGQSTIEIEKEKMAASETASAFAAATDLIHGRSRKIVVPKFQRTGRS